jgi:hypothetical protein
MALESSILNFLRMSLVYLAWCTNVPSFDCLIYSPRKNCNSPIMLISNSLLMSFAKLATETTLEGRTEKLAEKRPSWRRGTRRRRRRCDNRRAGRYRSLGSRRNSVGGKC